MTVDAVTSSKRRVGGRSNGLGTLTRQNFHGEETSAEQHQTDHDQNGNDERPNELSHASRSPDSATSNLERHDRRAAAYGQHDFASAGAEVPAPPINVAE